MPKPRLTHAVRQLEPGKKLLLAGLTIAAVAVPIGAGLLDAPPGHAQSQPRAEARMSFDVASVKPSTQQWLQIAPVLSPGRVRWTSDLTYMISYAYRMPPLADFRSDSRQRPYFRHRCHYHRGSH